MKIPASEVDDVLPGTPLSLEEHFGIVGYGCHLRGFENRVLRIFEPKREKEGVG
jgi:hypothetical protein